MQANPQMYSFRDVHLLPHFLKRQRIKTPEEQSQVPHSYFCPFNFSLVELFIQKKLSIQAFTIQNTHFQTWVFCQFQDFSLISWMWTYLKPLWFHTLAPDLSLSTACVAIMSHLVSEWRLLTFPLPTVNEYKCSAEVFSILIGKIQLDFLVSQDCSNITNKNFCFNFSSFWCSRRSHVQQLHIALFCVCLW